MARIALDIDSTLHHYWDLFEDLAMERFGVALPYAEQRTWGTDALDAEKLRALVMETHAEENVLAAQPYPHAVETVRDWHAGGHWIHVTSHRADTARTATETWLDRIGMPYDDLHCSYDKVTRCVELGIHVLVDDSPVNLVHAREAGIVGATIVHPWNEPLVDQDGIVGGRDWIELRERLDPILERIGA